MCLAALGVAIASALAVGCGGGAKHSAFEGVWQGHAHTLKITKTGEATEWVYLGCCHLVVKLGLRVSRPRGTRSAATADATVTRVNPGHERWFKSWFTKPLSVPHAGETKTIHLRDGVFLEPFTSAYYCGRVWRPRCGI